MSFSHKVYSLDQAMQSTGLSGRCSYPGIYPAPMTEEEKKWWTEFNLKLLSKELPTEEALQYDWAGLRAELEKHGSLTDKHFQTYHRADGAIDAVEISKDHCHSLPIPKKG